MFSGAKPQSQTIGYECFLKEMKTYKPIDLEYRYTRTIGISEPEDSTYFLNKNISSFNK
jgi:hypothetical protein